MMEEIKRLGTSRMFIFMAGGILIYLLNIDLFRLLNGFLPEILTIREALSVATQEYSLENQELSKLERLLTKHSASPKS